MATCRGWTGPRQSRDYYLSHHPLLAAAAKFADDAGRGPVTGRAGDNTSGHHAEFDALFFALASSWPILAGKASFVMVGGLGLWLCLSVLKRVQLAIAGRCSTGEGAGSSGIDTGGPSPSRGLRLWAPPFAAG